MKRVVIISVMIFLYCSLAYAETEKTGIDLTGQWDLTFRWFQYGEPLSAILSIKQNVNLLMIYVEEKPEAHGFKIGKRVKKEYFDPEKDGTAIYSGNIIDKDYMTGTMFTTDSEPWQGIWSAEKISGGKKGQSPI